MDSQPTWKPYETSCACGFGTKWCSKCNRMLCYRLMGKENSYVKCHRCLTTADLNYVLSKIPEDDHAASVAAHVVRQSVLDALTRAEIGHYQLADVCSDPTSGSHYAPW